MRFAYILIFPNNQIFFSFECINKEKGETGLKATDVVYVSTSSS